MAAWRPDALFKVPEAGDQGDVTTVFPSDVLSGFTAIAAGAGRVVAVGWPGILLSRDGATFDFISDFTTNSVPGVTYGNGELLTVDHLGNVFTSADGAKWNEQATLPAATGHFFCSVTYGGGIFAATDNAYNVFHSTDAVNWTKESVVPNYDLDGYPVVRYLGGYFWVSDYSWKTSYRSTDAVHWTPVTTSADVFGGGRWLNTEEYYRFKVSTDGSTWQPSPYPGPPYGKICFANGLFCGVDPKPLHLRRWAHLDHDGLLRTNQRPRCVVLSGWRLRGLHECGNLPFARWPPVGQKIRRGLLEVHLGAGMVVATVSDYNAPPSIIRSGVNAAGLEGAPIAATVAASEVANTQATLHGTVDPGGAATTIFFQYGATSGLGQMRSLPGVALGGGGQSFALPVDSLQPNTTYYFRVVASNSEATVTGDLLTFKTTANHAPVAVDDGPVPAHRPGTLRAARARQRSRPGWRRPSIGSATTAHHGTVTLTGNTLSYLPREVFAGTDEFTYTISDPFGGTATARVSVKLNSAPLAHDDGPYELRGPAWPCSPCWPTTPTPMAIRSM